jgi:NAD(P)-dependent dehydrogenase (short-subunit alcohol dehydrogenase family)
MRQLAGKTAFVTGASGIGFALGRAFAKAGVKVMLGDIGLADGYIAFYLRKSRVRQDNVGARAGGASRGGPVWRG